MALTRSFGDTVRARVERDPPFREALLTEAVDRLLAGEVDVGKALLHDFIEGTIGFGRLAVDSGTPSETLAWMLRPEGDHTAADLLALLGRVQQASGIHLHVAAD